MLLWLIMALESKDNNVRNRSENGARGNWAGGTPSISYVSLVKRDIFSSLLPSPFWKIPQSIRGQEWR
jgi:hypothetical protein